MGEWEGQYEKDNRHFTFHEKKKLHFCITPKDSALLDANVIIRTLGVLRVAKRNPRTTRSSPWARTTKFPISYHSWGQRLSYIFRNLVHSTLSLCMIATLTM